MQKIPKPLPCSERWAHMTPTEGGRLCQSCSKVIVDFRKKSWRGIFEIQAENANSVCGIYSEKQLKNWGQEPPKNSKVLRRAASVMAISTAISCTVLSEVKNNRQQLVIHGTVTGDHFSKQKHTIVPVQNATIRIDSLNIESITDSLGNFSFTMQKSQIKDSIVELTAINKFYGEQKITINTNEIINDSLHVQQHLKPVISEVGFQETSFYVAPPTIIESLKEKIDTLTGKK